MNNIKEVDDKNCKYCFFDDMINVQNLDPNKIKLNERSYKNIFIYHNGYVKVKDLSYAAINVVNSSYFMINKTNMYPTFKRAMEVKFDASSYC